MRTLTKSFTLLITVLMVLALPAKARGGNGPLPINPQERAFFDYLTRVAKIRFGDNLQHDPWFTCENRNDSLTFFSASLFQFTNNKDISKNVRAWVAGLFDHAYWASVKSAVCKFDINHFNECYANGSFTLYFRNNRVVSFYERSGRKWCDPE